jgi:cell division protein FtsQ
MWNKPQLMTAIADLLFAAAAAVLLFSAAVWLTRLPHFRLTQVAVSHELVEVRRADIERALGGMLRGNFFSVDIEAVRSALEKISWVRRAEVRRHWPSSLELRIEEHRPVAFWGVEGGTQLVNSHGEIFSGVMSSPRPLATLRGPQAVAADMLAQYNEAVELLRPLGRRPRILSVSSRLAVQIELDDGLLIELGRQQAGLPLRARLQRFAEQFPAVAGTVHARPSVVDMRYPNGFALRLPVARGSESKGTQ